MFQNYTPGPEGLWLRNGVQGQLAGLELLVFDVDGVLMDTGTSYPDAISQAVQTYFTQVLQFPGRTLLIERADSALFKAAGGFNSDWELAMAAVLFYLAKSARIGLVDLEILRTAPPSLAEFTTASGRAGGGLAGAERVALAGLPEPLVAGVRRDWDRPLIERLCCEHYGGTDWCLPMFGFVPQIVREPGLFNRETPLIRPEVLDRWSGPIGIYTGRVGSEARPALARCGLAERVPDWALLSADGAHVKPDPGGLDLLARQTGARSGLFIGDNIDDLRTVQRYRQELPAGAPFLFAGILGGALGDRTGSIFAAMDADLIATDVNAVLAAVR